MRLWPFDRKVKQSVFLIADSWTPISEESFIKSSWGFLYGKKHLNIDLIYRRLARRAVYRSRVNQKYENNCSTPAGV